MSKANNSDPSVSILVLGMEASGKSAFIGQLLGRVQRVKNSRLVATSTPASLKPYLAVLERLERGLPPEHTEAGAYSETPLQLEDRVLGPIQLIWPEYAGEQVKDLLATRQVSAEWRARVSSSDVWMLFVRPSQAGVPDDLISRRIFPAPAVEEPTQAPSEAHLAPTEVSAQAELIELLQLLLFVRGVGIVKRVQLPVLGVFLSCIDEVVPRESGVAPRTILEQRIPLLAHFVTSNWLEQSHRIFGVASLGQTLDPNQPNEDFALSGPESQGYMVLPNGTTDSDLTLGVSALLTLLSEV